MKGPRKERKKGPGREGKKRTRGKKGPEKKKKAWERKKKWV